MNSPTFRTRPTPPSYAGELALDFVGTHRAGGSPAQTWNGAKGLANHHCEDGPGDAEYMMDELNGELTEDPNTGIAYVCEPKVGPKA